jgi:hypothetical protein
VLKVSSAPHAPLFYAALGHYWTIAIHSFSVWFITAQEFFWGDKHLFWCTLTVATGRYESGKAPIFDSGARKHICVVSPSIFVGILFQTAEGMPLHEVK